MKPPAPSFQRLLLAALIVAGPALTCRAEGLPLVERVELQPLSAQVRQVVEGLEMLGQPLPGPAKGRLDRALAMSDQAAAVRAIQEALDEYCLIGVTINPESRVIQALQRIPIDANVPHHSIVLQLKHPTSHGRGDGLVPYYSAHLDSATSEVLVRGFHVQVGEPGVTNELRRILRIHLAESSAEASAGTSTR